MAITVARGFRRSLAVISVAAVGLGAAVSAMRWQESQDRWLAATKQPTGDVVVALPPDFGSFQFEMGTTEKRAKERIDQLKRIPVAGYLIDCTAESLDAGTEDEKTGCKTVPLAESIAPVSYIYQWGTTPAANRLLSRKAVWELEQGDRLSESLKRLLVTLRSSGKWPPPAKAPTLNSAAQPLMWSGAGCALLWSLYLAINWVIQGFFERDPSPPST